MKKKSALVMIVLLLAAMVTLYAQDAETDWQFDAALDAYVDGDYVAARQALEPLAEAGRSEAQFLLGVIYERGFSVERDLATAQSWYLRSRRLHNRRARAAAARLSKLLGPEQTRLANDMAADDRLVLHKDHGCISFFGEPFQSHYVTLLQSREPVEEMVEEILGFTGLAKNFEVQAASVANAAAVVQNNVRYLLYNPQFIDSVNHSSGTPWAAYSVMAHEIGHHLQGHTIQPGGSRPPIELEADSFSGFVLAQMGATLEEAQAAMATIASPRETPTHPARDDRLAAIAEGWHNAQRRSPSTSPQRRIKPIWSRTGAWRQPTGSSCTTPIGTCPMGMPVPGGRVCYCPSRHGWIAGYTTGRP